MHKLMVYVKPYENSEDPDKSNEETNKSTKDLVKSIKDRNVDLVYRGLPSFPVRLGYDPEFKENAKPVDVQSVVVFEVVGAKLNDAQKSFLDHLIRGGIVLKYVLFDEIGRIVDQSE